MRFDRNKDSIYGILQYPMEQGRSDLVLKEAQDYGIEVKHKTAEFEKYRTVQQWRLDHSQSYTAELLNNAIVDLNKTFNYKLAGIQDIQYLEYHAEDEAKYDWHYDIGDGVKGLRKLSISWCLNEGYIGGDLEFFAEAGEPVRVNPKPTMLVAFTSFFNHRVTPIKKGIRKVIVAWVYGEAWS